MANLRNFGVVQGRLARDPKVLSNKDGSRTVLFTVIAKNNYVSRDGEVGTEAIPLKAFVSAENVNERRTGVYPYLKQGKAVTVGYHVRTESFERDGETVYNTALMVDSVDLSDTNRNEFQSHLPTTHDDVAEDEN